MISEHVVGASKIVCKMYRTFLFTTTSIFEREKKRKFNLTIQSKQSVNIDTNDKRINTYEISNVLLRIALGEGYGNGRIQQISSNLLFNVWSNLPGQHIHKNQRQSSLFWCFFFFFSIAVASRWAYGRGAFIYVLLFALLR